MRGAGIRFGREWNVDQQGQGNPIGAQAGDQADEAKREVDRRDENGRAEEGPEDWAFEPGVQALEPGVGGGQGISSRLYIVCR